MKAEGKDQVGKLGFLELFWTETCLKSLSMALTVSIREGKKEQINLIYNKYKNKECFNGGGQKPIQIGVRLILNQIWPYL